MDDLRQALPAIPATDPIYTKGNIFCCGQARFIIRGICYVSAPRPVDQDANHDDVLSAGHLDELKRDMELFKELGLNAIRVSSLSPKEDHREAMELLREAGIYVLVNLGEGFEAPPMTPPSHWPDPDFDSSLHTYSAEYLKDTLQVVDEMSKYSNLLGFAVEADAARSSLTSKMSEIVRALIADVKKFLHLRRGRNVPIGVSLSEIMSIRQSLISYFTAGTKDERADFLAIDSWGWAGKSSFKISGWESMVRSLANYPVPMFLGAFGNTAHRPRGWYEVLSLYSTEMTDVVSGGLVYNYPQYRSDQKYGNSRYSIVVFPDGVLEKSAEFQRLKKQFRVIDQRKQDEVYSTHVKDYEGWIGEFPERSERWHATPQLPRYTGDWSSLIHDLEDEQDWVIVQETERAPTPYRTDERV